MGVRVDRMKRCAALDVERNGSPSREVGGVLALHQRGRQWDATKNGDRVRLHVQSRHPALDPPRPAKRRIEKSAARSQHVHTLGFGGDPPRNVHRRGRRQPHRVRCQRALRRRRQFRQILRRNHQMHPIIRARDRHHNRVGELLNNHARDNRRCDINCTGHLKTSQNDCMGEPS